MSAPKTRRPPITLTPQEKLYYDQLWNELDSAGEGFLSRSDAMVFFDKSGSDPETLAQIWERADPDNKGVLGRNGFNVALRFIGRAQTETLTAFLSVAQPGPLPRFGYDAVFAGKKIHSTVSEDWDENDLLYCQGAFLNLTPTNGYVRGVIALESFMMFGLSKETLTGIWELIDSQNLGKLDLHRFTIAYYYIKLVLRGSTELPNSVPEAVVQACKQTPAFSATSQHSSPSSLPANNTTDYMSAYNSIYETTFKQAQEKAEQELAVDLAAYQAQQQHQLATEMTAYQQLQEQQEKDLAGEIAAYQELQAQRQRDLAVEVAAYQTLWSQKEQQQEKDFFSTGEMAAYRELQAQRERDLAVEVAAYQKLRSEEEQKLTTSYLQVQKQQEQELADQMVAYQQLQEQQKKELTAQIAAYQDARVHSQTQFLQNMYANILNPTFSSLSLSPSSSTSTNNLLKALQNQQAQQQQEIVNLLNPYAAGPPLATQSQSTIVQSLMDVGKNSFKPTTGGVYSNPVQQQPHNSQPLPPRPQPQPQAQSPPIAQTTPSKPVSNAPMQNWDATTMSTSGVPTASWRPPVQQQQLQSPQQQYHHQQPHAGTPAYYPNQGQQRLQQQPQQQRPEPPSQQYSTDPDDYLTAYRQQRQYSADPKDYVKMQQQQQQQNLYQSQQQLYQQNQPSPSTSYQSQPVYPPQPQQQQYYQAQPAYASPPPPTSQEGYFSPSPVPAPSSPSRQQHQCSSPAIFQPTTVTTPPFDSKNQAPVSYPLQGQQQQQQQIQQQLPTIYQPPTISRPPTGPQQSQTQSPATARPPQANTPTRPANPQQRYPEPSSSISSKTAETDDLANTFGSMGITSSSFSTLSADVQKTQSPPPLPARGPQTHIPRGAPQYRGEPGEDSVEPLRVGRAPQAHTWS